MLGRQVGAYPHPLHLTIQMSASLPASPVVGAIILYSIDTQTTQFQCPDCSPSLRMCVAYLLAGDRTTSGLLVYAQSRTSHCPITLDFHALIIVIIIER
jgi:hypothetical protein